MTKSLMVLSGGLDSAVAATLAKETSRLALALTFDYGHKASLKEQDASKKIAKWLNIPHQILSIPWLGEITKTALVDAKSKIPRPEKTDLDNMTLAQALAKDVWVPNRNGLFLNIAACFAESLDIDVLITGFNAEEGLTFSDNSLSFVRAADEFFWYATQKKIKVESPTLKMNKLEIARMAARLKLPIEDLWFCYDGGKTPCQRCESCLRDFRALEEAGIKNPWR